MKAVRTRGFWAAGLIIAVLGVWLAKNGESLRGIGYLLSCGGLLIIMLGIRRRALERTERPAESKSTTEAQRHRE